MSIVVRLLIALAFASAPALAVVTCTADQDCNYPGCNDMPCSFSGVSPRCMLDEGCSASLGSSSGILYDCKSHGMSVQVQQHDSMLVLRPHPAPAHGGRGYFPHVFLTVRVPLRCGARDVLHPGPKPSSIGSHDGL